MRSPFLDARGMQAVLFDLDGVLIDSMPFHYEAYRRVLAAEGLSVERADIYLREGMGTPQVLRALSEEKGWGLPAGRIEELANRRREIFYQIYEHRVFAQVPDLLTWLSEAGYRLGVVSGATQQSLEMCLRLPIPGKAQALRQWFSLAVSGTSVARGKPFPDPFLKALGKLGLQAHEVVVVENAPIGIQSARAARCACFALETTLPRELLDGADWIVRDHTALAEKLQGLES